MRKSEKRSVSIRSVSVSIILDFSSMGRHWNDVAENIIRWMKGREKEERKRYMNATYQARKQGVHARIIAGADLQSMYMPVSLQAPCFYNTERFYNTETR